MSVYLLTILLALLVAQGSKVLMVLAYGKKDEWRDALLGSGGMPSAHSALVVSMAIVVGVEEGVNSALFGLALALALITMYDAFNVRRSVGEQGTAIKQIVTELKLVAEGYTYKQANGHQPGEVLVGALTGVAVAFLALFLS